MANKTSEKLTLKHIVGYGCGDAGGTLTLYMVSGYMSRYLQVHLQVNAAVLATILLIWNIWDAVNDPMMGTIMDVMFAKSSKKNPNADKYRPWILWSIPPIVLGMIAFYGVPQYLGGGFAMLAAAFILKIVYEAGYTMMNIGMGSLLGGMATNDSERATLSTARGYGSTFAGLIGGIIIPQCIAKFGDSINGYFISSIIIACCGGLLIFLHYALTEERNKSSMLVEKTPEQEAAEKIKPTDILNVFRKNRAFLALVLHSICICFVQGMGQGATSYMYIDVIGNVSLQSVASVLSTVLMLVVLAVAPIITKKIDLVDVIRVLLVVGGVAYATLLAYCLMVDELNGLLVAVWIAIAGAGVTCSVQLQWGLVAEAIDYNEYLTGKRNEGSIYGMFSFSRRLGSMLAASAAVLVIAGIGYDTAATAAGLSQTQSVKDGITMMVVGLPVLAAIGSFCCFTFIWNLRSDVRAKMAAWREERSAK